MNDQQIIDYFKKFNYQIRPQALLHLKETTEKQQIQIEKIFLQKVVDQIGLIFEENDLIDQYFVELEIVWEALAFLQLSQNVNKEEQNQVNEKLYENSVVFSSCFEEIKKNDNHLAKLAEEKYNQFLQMIQHSPMFYYDFDHNKAIQQNSYLINKIGQIKGLEGEYIIFGVLYEKKRQLFLQDQTNEIKIKINANLTSDFYICSGAFLILQGQMNFAIFEVKKILNNYLMPSLHFEQKLFKEIFYQNINKAQKTSGNQCHLIQNSNQSIFFSVIQNFCFNEENFGCLQNYIYLNSLQKPSFFILAGNFFDLQCIGSAQEKQEFDMKLEMLWKFLSVNKIYLESLKIFLLPERNDFGLQTFPWQQIPFFYFQKIIEEFPFVYLLENPAWFQYQGNVFAIAKNDQANTILWQTKINVEQNKEAIEIMSLTIMQQISLAPYLENQLNKIYVENSSLNLQGNENYVIVCDNFIPFGEIKINGINFIYVPNFSLTKSVVQIFPKENKVELKEVPQNE